MKHKFRNIPRHRFVANNAAAKQAQTKFAEGLDLHQKGQLAQAQALYQQVLKLQSGHFDALHLLGVIAAQTNNPTQAVELIGKAIAINPNNPAAHLNCGNALQDLKQHQAAIESYDKAISIKPDYAEAYSNRGVALNDLKQHQAALESCDKAISIKPDYAGAYLNRGNTLQDLKQHQFAIESYDKAISIKPDYAEAYSNRGKALNDLKLHQATIESCEKAISIKPDYADAYSNRGNALNDLKQHQAALESCDKAISIKPDYAEAYSNRGNVLNDLRQHQAALESYEKAISIKPDYAEAYSNRGNALQNLRQHQAALESYEKAISIMPDYAEGHWNQSLCYLRMGDFERGWVKYEWRWKNEKLDSFKNKRNFAQPLWLGAEDLKGKTILLHSEQGLGDSLQFCRYAKLVSDLGARVILEVETSLMGLLASLQGVAELVAKGNNLPAFDYYCPLASLPLAFKTNIDTIPAWNSYLAPVPGKVAQWQAKLGKKSKSRIGLVWSGSAGYENDHNRSIPLCDFVKLLPREFQYVSLQKETREIDMETLKSRPDILHFGKELEDFTDTAALCELLDIIVSVDTSVAHLAGALGKPVWILLPYNPDWRWLLDRNDSPWYPSAKLYRQEGDWDSMFQRVKTDLERTLTTTAA